jgi:hypothetical protein
VYYFTIVLDKGKIIIVDYPDLGTITKHELHMKVEIQQWCKQRELDSLIPVLFAFMDTHPLR